MSSICGSALCHPSLCTLAPSHHCVAPDWGKERASKILLFPMEDGSISLHPKWNEWRLECLHESTLGSHSHPGRLFSYGILRHCEGEESFKLLVEPDTCSLELGRIPRETRDCFFPGDAWKLNHPEQQNKLESLDSVLSMKGIGTHTQPNSHGEKLRVNYPKPITVQFCGRDWANPDQTQST